MATARYVSVKGTVVAALGLGLAGFAQVKAHKETGAARPGCDAVMLVFKMAPTVR